MHSIMETATLLSIIGGLVALAGFLVWNTLIRIEMKVDNHCAIQQKCREELPEKFVKKEDFKEWRTGRDEIWEALNNHSHDEKGRVIR